MTDHEKAILDKYSNSSLRRNQPKEPKPEPTTVTEVLPPVQDMTLPAELRALCREIQTACHNSRCSSVAAPAVSALIDYLSLRARMIELQS